jgi:hypothetical protein
MPLTTTLKRARPSRVQVQVLGILREKADARTIQSVIRQRIRLAGCHRSLNNQDSQQEYGKPWWDIHRGTHFCTCVMRRRDFCDEKRYGDPEHLGERIQKGGQWPLWGYWQTRKATRQGLRTKERMESSCLLAQVG